MLQRYKNVKNYEELHAILISEFHRAHSFCCQNEGSEDSTPFETAKYFGWDSQEDEEFMSCSLKATQPEIVVEGLVRALKFCRVRNTLTLEQISDICDVYQIIRDCDDQALEAITLAINKEVDYRDALN